MLQMCKDWAQSVIANTKKWDGGIERLKTS